MFLFGEPTDAKIRRFLDEQQDLPFTYTEVGATREDAPPGYTVDRYRVRLGGGESIFERARDAVRGWKMFDLGWVSLCYPDLPIQAGTTVAVLARHYGFRSLNAARIVYTVEEHGPVERYGFAYGTLPGHGERGEERFTVEWDREEGSVHYDVLAFSRPNQFLAWVGYPFARLLQRRFARDSKRSMISAVKERA